MNRLTELMVITMEECGELTQACSKVLRTRENNFSSKTISTEALDDLAKEVADVMCMIELMQEEGLVDPLDISEGIQNKREKLKVWSSLITEHRKWQDILADE